MALAVDGDVVARLGRPLNPDEEERVPGLLDEAEALLVGWLGFEPDPVPGAVTIVASRMVARALTGSTAVPGLASQQLTALSFGATQNFTPESSSGGVWLTRQDKVMIRPYGNRGRVVNLPTA